MFNDLSCCLFEERTNSTTGVKLVAVPDQTVRTSKDRNVTTIATPTQLRWRSEERPHASPHLDFVDGLYTSVTHEPFHRQDPASCCLPRDFDGCPVATPTKLRWRSEEQPHVLPHLDFVTGMYTVRGTRSGIRLFQFTTTLQSECCCRYTGNMSMDVCPFWNSDFLVVPQQGNFGINWYRFV